MFCRTITLRCFQKALRVRAVFVYLCLPSCAPPLTLVRLEMTREVPHPTPPVFFAQIQTCLWPLWISGWAEDRAHGDQEALRHRTSGRGSARGVACAAPSGALLPRDCPAAPRPRAQGRQGMSQWGCGVCAPPTGTARFSGHRCVHSHDLVLRVF